MNSLYAVVLLALLAALESSAVTAQSLTLFDSELAAVKAAADIYNSLSIQEDRKYMGTIYQVGGQFAYTVTPGVRHVDAMKLSIPRVDCDNVVAFWHTRGDASPQHRYFSNIDTQTVEKFGRPFYLADYTGFLKAFRPGHRTLSIIAARRLGLPAARGSATGEFVRDRFNRTVKVSTRRSKQAS